jgi:thiol-disulfide isomerase/thioredoxin
MKNLKILLLFLLLTGCSGDQTPTTGVPGLDALRGQWVVVNYWAEWCKPCIKEIPELNTLDEREGITVVGVNFDGETGDALAAQEQKLGIAFENLGTDPAAALGTTTPSVLPTSLILSPQGRLITTLIGPQTLETLEQALNEAGA